MIYERLLPFNVDSVDILTRILEYMEDKQDVNDGDLGPSPNKEMNFATDIRQLLWQIEAKADPYNGGKDLTTGMPFGRTINTP